MTSIASWVNKENDLKHSIWTIGDTKVVNLGSNESLSLESSKILELNIRCKNITQHPERRDYYFDHSIGFAYAGSSLAGLNSFASLNTILTNLGGDGQTYPDLRNISTTCARVIDYYCKSICSTENRFESLIFGYCPIQHQLQRYHISFCSSNFSYISKMVESDSVFLLGDKQKEIYQKIDIELEKHSSKKSIAYWRTPLRILSEITTSGLYETIGGGTQLAIADKFGCKLYQAVGERSNSDMKFRNIDIHNDIGIYVGNCLISIDGMYYQMK